MHLKQAIYESTLSTADAVPLPQWGRLRYEDTAFLDTTPFPKGKAKRRRLRRKKGSQPRLAVLGSPFQGKGLAWTLPPSYGRRCPEGAEVGWGKRDEKERGRSSKAGNLRKHPSAAGAVPLPQWGRLRYEKTAFPITSKRIHAYVKKRITTDKAFPSRGRCPVGADRALAAGKTDEESGTARNIWGSVSPLAKISHFARNGDTGI